MFRVAFKSTKDRSEILDPTAASADVLIDVFQLLCESPIKFDVL